MGDVGCQELSAADWPKLKKLYISSKVTFMQEKKVSGEKDGNPCQWESGQLSKKYT